MGKDYEDYEYEKWLKHYEVVLPKQAQVKFEPLLKLTDSTKVKPLSEPPAKVDYMSLMSKMLNIPPEHFQQQAKASGLMQSYLEKAFSVDFVATSSLVNPCAEIQSPTVKATPQLPPTSPNWMSDPSSKWPQKNPANSALTENDLLFWFVKSLWVERLTSLKSVLDEHKKKIVPKVAEEWVVRVDWTPEGDPEGAFSITLSEGVEGKHVLTRKTRSLPEAQAATAFLKQFAEDMIKTSGKGVALLNSQE